MGVANPEALIERMRELRGKPLPAEANEACANARLYMFVCARFDCMLSVLICTYASVFVRACMSTKACML